MKEKLGLSQSNWKIAAVTVIAVIVLTVAIGVGIIYSGVINIAASKPHYALTKWVLETTMEHSVERRAAQISPPVAFSATEDTAHHYQEMCGFCHGAPGKYPTEIGKGLQPKPPELPKVAGNMPDAELFWVIKNGIRMTGMPAFGVVHDDDKLWEVVAFVKELPQMSPNKYRQAVERH